MMAVPPMDEELEGPGPLSSFRVGTGPQPVVLLHGFLGSGRNLRALAQRWSSRDPARAFLLPDLLGHGFSPRLPPEGNLDVLAHTVLETARNAGLSAPFTLVGHSLGGRVALAAARIAPDDVARAVLLDIAPGPIDAARAQSLHVLEIMRQAPDTVPDRKTMRTHFVAAGFTPVFADWILMNVRLLPDGRYGWRVDREAFAALARRFHEDDLWPVVEAAPARVRCVRGARSGYVGDDDVARFARLGIAVATLENAGHYVHVEALEPLVAWLLDATELRPGAARGD